MNYRDSDRLLAWIDNNPNKFFAISTAAGLAAGFIIVFLVPVV